MTFAAISRAYVLLSLCVLLMAADALAMERLLKIQPGFPPMADETTDTLVPIHERAFIQDVLAVFINVMTILAQDAACHVAHMRERHFGPGLAS